MTVAHANGPARRVVASAGFVRTASFRATADGTPFDVHVLRRT